MKCFYCDQFFTDYISSKDHHVVSHNVDENNYFFQKPFTRDKFFVSRKCFRCDYFCLNKRDEKNHNFLAHQMGGRQPIEDKSLKKTFFHENLQRYCINLSKHEGYYDFYDSQKLADDFLTLFKNVFVPRPNLRRVCFKCSFTIINRQPAPKTGFVEITNSRVWQTNVHDEVYFDNFVKSNLAQDILKMVIMNGMTGSSWKFERFDKICLTANSDEFRNVDN